LIPSLLALAAGALLPLALAPFNLWPAAFVSLAIWFYLLQRYPQRAVLLSWLYGVGKYALGASWIYVSIHLYGNAPVVLAVFLVALFVAGMALFPASAGWLFRVGKTQGLRQAAAWFVFCYALVEWLLGWLFTGFPWLYSGYALLDTPLAGFAPVGGVLLLNLLVATIAVAVLTAWLEWRSARRSLLRAWSGAVVMILLLWGGGLGLSTVDWTQSTGTHQVALVQGNIDQAEKWLPESRGRIVETYLELSQPYWGVDLMVWPEAAITLFEHEAQTLLDGLDAQARSAGTGLILGLPAVDQLPGGQLVFRNTARGLGTAQGRYVKRRLVPFGEYVPLEGLLRGLIEFFDLPMSRAEPGEWEQPPLQLAGNRVQVAICYEIVYPDLVRVPAAELLLTISNDSWFGDSLGPKQHLQMARMRALENGRWLLRATNNGLTAIVNPRGLVTARLRAFEAGVLTGDYQTMTGLTPFARLGQIPFLLLLTGLAVLTYGLRKRTE
jgi:apolipoprotein N-acyltransferase